MTVQKQTLNRVSLGLSVVAMVLGVAAVVLSSRPAVPLEDDAYERVVREVWEIMQPIYRDMDLALTEQEPKTLRDALEPLVRMSGPLDGGL